ncbi:Spy/CpxP family protein refolding chaperone [Spirosoma spitsbergense]|uniref:Spy/CpxP family protein refolding chaperone n=1 Tax=Spirosoma spitsbergense TaxID=431554 RepID=UPI00036E736F|nr:periplasmic heavy metal sensor [Spirosoma spitsbergense]
MNDPRRTRLLTGIIIVLVALNIGLLGWIWLRSNRSAHRASRTSSRTLLADTLGLDARQKQQLADLQTVYFKQVRPRQRQLRQERKTYFRLTDSSFTEAQRREKALAFHWQSAEVELMTLAHFDKVAAICNPEQRLLLNHLLSELPGRATAGGAFRMPGQGGRGNRARGERNPPADAPN